MPNTAKRPPKGPKRRNERNILTFYEKIAVIRYYEETNVSRNCLAREFHCCATQIRKVLDRKEELLKQLATLSEADASIIIEEMTRKRRKFEMTAISFILHQWVERCRQMRLRKNITNQTLKDTALKMAAILNLPAFRPSYRWLNRFRGKYKYNDEDLGTSTEPTVIGELAVEDIIIEFKDALPSFMQKEISAITATAKMPDKSIILDVSHVSTSAPKVLEVPYDYSSDTSSPRMSSTATIPKEMPPLQPIRARVVATPILEPVSTSTENSVDSVPDATAADNRTVVAGTSTLLSGVFPHLAVIHQFALLNSDVKALELISQLGVHMQIQATCGAYKQLTLAGQQDNIYTADIDDIVLVE